MDITLDQLRAAVKRCTPGTPDSYAERLWAALEQAQRPDPPAAATCPARKTGPRGPELPADGKIRPAITITSRYANRRFP